MKRWAGALACLLPGVTSGCLALGGGGSGKGEGGPYGPLAHNVGEAWPDRPTGVAPLTPEDIAGVCVRIASCNASSGEGIPMDGVGYCAFQFEWSAERAIPISNLMLGQERPEFLADCVRSAADCAAVAACYTARDEKIYCEEDGCRVRGSSNASCQGDVASLVIDAEESSRDCSRAFAACDASSPTGCSDRPFTVCPDDAGEDRCEGDVVLGCDSKRQVTFRDCSRLGGACVDSGGVGACDYGPRDAECPAEGARFPACNGGSMEFCVVGRYLSVPAPDLCP